MPLISGFAVVAQADGVGPDVLHRRGSARSPAEEVQQLPPGRDVVEVEHACRSVSRNLGSPISTGGEIDPWIQAPRPIASATRNRFWMSRRRLDLRCASAGWRRAES